MTASALRKAAEDAWAEVESLRRELRLALALDGTSFICRKHTDDAYAAYMRARERAVAISQFADYAQGGFNSWARKEDVA